MMGYCLFSPLNSDYFFETASRAHRKHTTVNLLATKVFCEYQDQNKQ